jgi:hypothetical protein
MLLSIYFHKKANEILKFLATFFIVKLGPLFLSSKTIYLSNWLKNSWKFIISFSWKHEVNSYMLSEVRFASFLSGGFTTMAVINPQDLKLANRTSVYWLENCLSRNFVFSSYHRTTVQRQTNRRCMRLY